MEKIVTSNSFKNAWHLAKLQNKQRVNRTVLGYIWVFLPQILFIAVATTVFTLISGNNSLSHSLYVLVGMVFWVYFTEGYHPYAQQFSEGRGVFLNLNLSYSFLPITNFFRCFQIYLPLITLVATVFIISGQLELLMAPLFILCFFFGGIVSAMIPIVFSYLSLILKDFQPISTLFSQLLFFLSPIGWVEINFTPINLLNKLNGVAVTINLLRAIIEKDMDVCTYHITNLVILGAVSFVFVYVLHRNLRNDITIKI